MVLTRSNLRQCAIVDASLLIALLVAADGAQGETKIDFNRDIRPILSDNCFACHGPDPAGREADLRLDVEAEATADRGGYAAVVPGSLDHSELIRRITSTDDSERMPPPDTGKSLKSAEVELLKRWVGEGAQWSLPWTYVTPSRHPVPEVKDAAWPRNAIDRFILSRLEAENLRPSQDCEKRTLARRLYFDLIGLPPSSKEIDEFLADENLDAHERLVDRLLASPHFGERMAMYWLDLVRYADTVGYHGDQEHHISPYRDWVINAFNANMPFDQFTHEQLAGDLLPNATVDQKIASGYNRVLQTSHEGGVQPKEYLAIYAADHVRNLSAVWMGATIGCAQCHDHKYDPYTTRDFYSMAAFFADIDEAEHLTKAFDISPTPRYPELELLTPAQEASVLSLEAESEQLTQELADAKATNDSAKAADVEERLTTVKSKLDYIHATARRTMITVAIEPRVTRILPRGNWMDDSGEIVQPAIPESLGKLNVKDRRATRLDLANWLVDSENGAGGLTARVMANRFWYLAFGRGIASKLDDLGGQGEPPDHPELLDYLAIEFVDSGWNVKHMMKLLVMSRTYQQSSDSTFDMREKDPQNRLVARQARFRVLAESVRDTALKISGLLVPKVGGPSVRPYQPAGYYRHLNFPLREYVADTDDSQWRRGVYMHWQRQFLHPALKAFDAPSREECTAERARSCIAPAALAMLNDPTYVEAARVFAVRILQEGGSTTTDRLNFAFHEATSRSPDEVEQKLLGELLRRSVNHYEQNRNAADELSNVGVAKSPADLDRTELAAWTIVARAILNTSEVITRN
jgi:hypothetical protein